jgi:hypothetical protein
MTIRPAAAARRGTRRRRLALATVIVVMVAPSALLASSATAHHRAHRAAHRAQTANAAPASLDAFAGGALASGGDSSLQSAQVHDPTLDADAAALMAQGVQGMVWLIPTDDGRICLGLEPGGHYDRELPSGASLGVAFSCRPAASVDADGIELGIFNDAVGVVPEGVAAVTVTSATGVAQTIAVSGDVWRYSYPAAAAVGSASVTFVSGGETVSGPVF